MSTEPWKLLPSAPRAAEMNSVGEPMTDMDRAVKFRDEWFSETEWTDEFLEMAARHFAAARAEGYEAGKRDAAKSTCQLCHDGMGVYHYVSDEIDEFFHMLISQNKPSIRATCKAGYIWRLPPAPPAPDAAKESDK